MRILFISAYFPEDLSKSVHGVYKRMKMFLKALEDIAEIDFLLYAPVNKCHPETAQQIEEAFLKHWDIKINLFICPRAEFKEDTEIQKWYSLARGIFSFYEQKNRLEYSGSLQIDALEKCLDQKPDVVFAHRLSAMCPLLRTKRELPRVLFDMDDIEHVVLERYLKKRKNLRSKLLLLLIPALIKGERDALELASTTFVCSEEDRSYLEKKFGLVSVAAVPNAVSVPSLLPPTDEPNLLFLGSDYGPNLQAAEFLIDKIWPEIKERMPQAKLTIAGISSEKLNFSDSTIPGLELPGFVQDLDNLYKNTNVTVVPMLVGGGTRFKIIESAMYARPTVSTKVGAEGVELSDPEEIVIRDTPESFSDACAELLKDKELSQRIGLSARKKAIELYNIDNVLSSIKTYVLKP